MSTNLFISLHGKIHNNDKIRHEYLHLNEEGVEFGNQLAAHFKEIYFDHIFYQETDRGSVDKYNQCHNTIRNMKGLKSVFDKTQLSKVFMGLNIPGADIQNVMICFRADSFNVISNIIQSDSDEQFSKEYHKVYQYSFKGNEYTYVGKFTPEEHVEIRTSLLPG